MKRAATSLILALLPIGAVGCANYAPVASLHRQHQNYLEQLEVPLSLDREGRQRFASLTTPEAREELLKERREPRAEWYRTTIGSPQGASTLAQLKEGAARADAAIRPGDEKNRKILLNADLGQIQEDFFRESETDALRGRDLAALYLKLVEAVRA